MGATAATAATALLPRDTPGAAASPGAGVHPRWAPRAADPYPHAVHGASARGTPAAIAW